MRPVQFQTLTSHRCFQENSVHFLQGTEQAFDSIDIDKDGFIEVRDIIEVLLHTQILMKNPLLM